MSSSLSWWYQVELIKYQSFKDYIRIKTGYGGNFKYVAPEIVANAKIIGYCIENVNRGKYYAK